MSKLIVANWKMNGTLDLVDAFLESIESDELILGLPNIFLAYSSSKNKNINLAAQDCSIFKNNGAHTGEVSAKMLSESGVSYVILGHSERRSSNNETIDIIYQKMESALEAGLKVILCVDENYKELIDSKTNTLLRNNTDSIVIAYEPVSAIGTGIVPSVSEIDKVISEIKGMYYNLKTLYGGSVNTQNSHDILSIKSVDGVLIGGASLKLAELTEILKSSI